MRNEEQRQHKRKIYPCMLLVHTYIETFPMMLNVYLVALLLLTWSSSAAAVAQRTDERQQAAMEQAAKADLEEVAYWMGGHVIEGNRTSKKPQKTVYIKARDFFRLDLENN